MFCPKCGTSNDERAKFCQSCGTAFQPKPPQPGAVLVGSYAGFWARFVAWLIDFIIVMVGSGIIASVTFGFGVFLGFVAPWLYEAFMLSSEWQATVGKRAMNMVVTRPDGTPLNFARATGRHFAKYISAFTLGIGFIIAAFTANKQALHDMIADTVVTYK